MLAAAREVYGERGWSGFTIDEVARRAGAGKGSLYLRWPDKGALLVAAVRSAVPSVGDIDRGCLEDDLREFARQWMAFVRSKDGSMTTRLWMDRQSHADLAEVLPADDYPAYIRSTRSLVRRAIKRGEIESGVSPAVVGDLVAGAITNHVRSTPEVLAGVAHTDAYVELVVAVVLRGVGYRRAVVPAH